MTYNEVAAKWWADTLSNPKLTNFNMGEENSTGALAMALGMLNAKKQQATDEAIISFEQSLSELIQKKTEHYGSMELYCDYHPDEMIDGLAQKHGIDSSGFPWKTRMVIKPNKVTVSCGYGEPYQIIFPE